MLCRYVLSFLRKFSSTLIVATRGFLLEFHLMWDATTKSYIIRIDTKKMKRSISMLTSANKCRNVSLLIPVNRRMLGNKTYTSLFGSYYKEGVWSNSRVLSSRKWLWFLVIYKVKVVLRKQTNKTDRWRVGQRLSANQPEQTGKTPDREILGWPGRDMIHEVC